MDGDDVNIIMGSVVRDRDIERAATRLDYGHQQALWERLGPRVVFDDISGSCPKSVSDRNVVKTRAHRTSQVSCSGDQARAQEVESRCA